MLPDTSELMLTEPRANYKSVIFAQIEVPANTHVVTGSKYID